MTTLPNEYGGYILFDKELDKLPLSRITISTINQYSFCIAEDDPEFKQALKESDVLLPDGVGIVVAVKATRGHSIKKISGSDLHLHMLKKLNEEHGSCFYLGSSQHTLEKIKKRLAAEYPHIDSHVYSPPFKPLFSNEENLDIIRKINKVKPDVLFVGMTAPKQEKWVNNHKLQIDAKIICSIGAVFDFYGGVITRPSKFWVGFGLEWFIRLCKEPKRMWRRYVYYGPVFVYKLIKEMMKNRSTIKIPSEKLV